MLRHSELGKTKEARHRKVRSLIKSNAIALAGCAPAKIYGRLDCTTGKSMRFEHRVFFKNEAEAIHRGYRPCGHCMKSKYVEWKKGRLNYKGDFPFDNAAAAKRESGSGAASLSR